MLDKEFVIFDIETTDAELDIPEIVEIGAILVSANLKIEDEFESFVRPSHLENFTRYSQELTGISRQSLETAELWSGVWRKWADFTRFKQRRLFSWTAFDPFVLRVEYRRLRLEYPHADLPICIPSMVYFYAACRGWNQRTFSLSAIASELGVTQEKNHRALHDAVTALKILREIYNSNPMDNSSDDEPFRLFEV